MASGPAAAAVLLLADSRLPAGGYAHSGGVEPAVAAGLIRDDRDLALFVEGRLRTAGLVAAALTAAACARARDGHSDWLELDDEADARTPSPAQRDASRRQGRGLLRAGAAAWPRTWLLDVAPDRDGPHHAVALGAVAAAAGVDPVDAALVSGHLFVAGAASAAVRLLGLDPLDVHALQARLAVAVAEVAERAAATCRGALADLPSDAAPVLDLLAEAHARADLQLFVS